MPRVDGASVIPDEDDVPTIIAVAQFPKLDQALAEYASIEAQIAPLAERLDELKGIIKSETRKAVPWETAKRVFLQSPYFGGAVKSITRKGRWTFDTKRFQNDHPITWVKYAKQGFTDYFETVK